MGWDSNPRIVETITDLAGQSFKPLRHPSENADLSDGFSVNLCRVLAAGKDLILSGSKLRGNSFPFQSDPAKPPGRFELPSAGYESAALPLKLW